MKIASWTLDGVAGHTADILRWLEANEPTVVCLRGTHVADCDFPLLPLWEMGYYTKLFGAADQPGVAILSVEPPRDVHRGLDEPGKRCDAVSGRVAGLRIVNVDADVDEGAVRGYLDRRVAPHEKLLVVGGLTAGALGLVDLARGVLANPQLARRCSGVEEVAGLAAGGDATVVTFEGLPPPQIPDLDITR